MKTKITIALAAVVALFLFTGFPFGSLGRLVDGTPPLPLVRVNTQEMQQLADQFRAEKEERLRSFGESPQLLPATTNFTGRALIAIYHSWTTTPVINITITMNEINRRLFSDNAVVDFDALHRLKYKRRSGSSGSCKTS